MGQFLAQRDECTDSTGLHPSYSVCNWTIAAGVLKWFSENTTEIESETHQGLGKLFTPFAGVFNRDIVTEGHVGEYVVKLPVLDCKRVDELRQGVLRHDGFIGEEKWGREAVGGLQSNRRPIDMTWAWLHLQTPLFKRNRSVALLFYREASHDLITKLCGIIMMTHGPGPFLKMFQVTFVYFTGIAYFGRSWTSSNWDGSTSTRTDFSSRFWISALGCLIHPVACSTQKW